MPPLRFADYALDTGKYLAQAASQMDDGGEAIRRLSKVLSDSAMHEVLASPGGRNLAAGVAALPDDKLPFVNDAVLRGMSVRQGLQVLNEPQIVDSLRPLRAIDDGAERERAWNTMEGIVPRGTMAPPGTPMYSANPYSALLLRYPEDMRTAAAKRIPNEYQMPGLPDVPVFLRQESGIDHPGGRSLGRAPMRFYSGDDFPSDRSVDVAAKNAPWTVNSVLEHELGHTIQPRKELLARPKTALYKTNEHNPSGSYFARPAEMAQYLGEVARANARIRGKFIETPRQADDAMEYFMDGPGATYPLSGGDVGALSFYWRAYKNNPTARKHISNILKTVYGVGGAMAMTPEDSLIERLGEQ
jgi:hypothetical protein